MGITASVLIPAYNAAKFIRSAIDSALSQTLQDIEVVVIDDASDDATWDVVTECRRCDPRVRSIRRTQRGGPSAALNMGIEQANGRWIAVLDADDIFLPERLAEMIPRADALGADMIADNLQMKDLTTGADLGLALADDLMTTEGPLSLIEMVRRDMPDMPTRNRFGFVQPIKRREFLMRTGVRFQEDIATGEDFLFYFECVARGARLHVMPGAWYVYSVWPGSITSSGRYTPHLPVANLRQLRIAEELGDLELVALLRRRQTMIEFSCFRQLLSAGQIAACLSHAWRVPLPYLAWRFSSAAYRRISGRVGEATPITGQSS